MGQGRVKKGVKPPWEPRPFTGLNRYPAKRDYKGYKGKSGDADLPRRSLAKMGGITEISRWCQPPDRYGKYGEPRSGRRNGIARFPPPLPGLVLLFAENRWFAPPANLRCPSGTSPAKRTQSA